ncbi:MAG: alpha/beta hydrolase [Thermodesulfobacteriota bacterium]
MRWLRRLALVVLAVVVAALAVPPLWFAVVGDAVPAAEMPPPGRRVVLPSGLGLNVLDRGAGQPVVLVHGLPGNGYEWRALQDELVARGRRAIAYDRAGFGRSDPRPAGGEYTVEASATDLLQLLDALALGDATVVGWSYGGAVAMAAAQRDPARIGRLVLVGSAGPGSEDNETPLVIRLVLSDLGLLWLRAVPPAGRAVREGGMRNAFSDQPMPDWWMPLAHGNFARPGTGLAFVSEMRASQGKAWPGPAGIDAPIVVVHGDDDRLARIAIAREIERLAPRGRLVVVEGGSHMLPVTHATLLADEILR